MKSVIIVVSILLIMPIVSIVSSCNDPELRPTKPRGTTDGDRPAVVVNRRVECTSSDDVCDSNQCSQDPNYCDYYESRSNNDCSDACKDLFTGDARKECLRYKPDIVFGIEEMIDTIFRRPTEDSLADVEDELLCVLLKIGPQPWLDEIEEYSRSRAETVLKWVVDEDIGPYFMTDEEQKDVMEQLFVVLGGEERVTAENIFAGFKREMEDDDENDIPALFYISENDGSRNSETFQFVHELTLVDEVCKESNRPRANVARVSGTAYDTQCGGDPCYGKDIEASATGIADRVSIADAEDEFDLQACILGVYCHISDGYTDAEDFRETVADILDDSEVMDFIEIEVAEGGLGLEDAEEWPDTACAELRRYWNNNKSSGSGLLDLGLGN